MPVVKTVMMIEVAVLAVTETMTVTMMMVPLTEEPMAFRGEGRTRSGDCREGGQRQDEGKKAFHGCLRVSGEW